MIARKSEHEDLDFDELREDLLDHYGPGITFDPELPTMVIDVERANEDELVRLAEHAGFDLDKYEEQ